MITAKFIIKHTSKFNYFKFLLDISHPHDSFIRLFCFWIHRLNGDIEETGGVGVLEKTKIGDDPCVFLYRKPENTNRLFKILV